MFILIIATHKSREHFTKQKDHFQFKIVSFVTKVSSLVDFQIEMLLYELWDNNDELH